MVVLPLPQPERLAHTDAIRAETTAMKNRGLALRRLIKKIGAKTIAKNLMVAVLAATSVRVLIVAVEFCTAPLVVRLEDSSEQLAY